MENKKYTVPDFNRWGGTLRRKDPPKYFCKDCVASLWCNYAIWADGCDENMEESSEK